MSKYYIKKLSKQDVTRTTVLNSEAVTDFFELDLENRDDEEIILVKYPGESGYRNIRIAQKQDPRVYLKELDINENDLLIFKKTDDANYEIQVITDSDPGHEAIEMNLIKGYLISDVIPGKARFNVAFSEPQKEKENMTHPLNQILFGPPGTGKTDSTVEIALDILGKNTNDRYKNREVFRSLLHKRIFFVTMHSSYSYEDFVQGLKPKSSENGELLFEPKDGVFKEVSEKAKELYYSDGETEKDTFNNDELLKVCFYLSKYNNKGDKKANQLFNVSSNKELYELLGKHFETSPNSIKNHRDKFDYLVSEERNGWTPKNNNGELHNSEEWPYQDVYNELNSSSLEDLENLVNEIWGKIGDEETVTTENINFVLILDEINRANISKVFGELITLLEEDKRLGGKNELSVTLPSGDEFSVPPNLFVIGTMNTADKSIALVDIALRRRFQFKPVYPNAEVIRKYSKGTNIDKAIKFFNELNNLLRKEKSVDFQIGHSYFLGVNSLEEVINENVIPLLTEYFRNDLDKVKDILSSLGSNVDDDYYDKTGLLKVNS